MRVLRSLGTTCGICGGEVDLKVRSPDPRAPSIDHIVAVANGGTHDVENLQIAHLWCNQAKHLRRSADQDGYAERQRFYNLRAWRRLAKLVRDEEPTCRVCGDASACAVHITPLQAGGKPWERENIMATCKRCRNHRAQETYRESVR